MMECRQLLEQSNTAWLSGDRHRTWVALKRAAELAESDASLKAEVEAWRSVALVRAELQSEAAEAAERCLSLAKELTEDSVEFRRAVAHARVSLATSQALLDRAPENTAACLAVLEQLVEDRDPELEEVRSRAVSNILVVHIKALSGRLHESPVEVEAWSRVSWARTVAQKFSYQGTLVRQAIDLAFLTGQWERGWDYARLSENAELPRDEQVGVWSKAALLAWERGWDGYARWFGRKALRATTAVSIPWVRLYGYLGGVIAAAAGAGAVRSALDSYVRCVTTEEHATRSHRALQAGLIGLEAGCGPDEVRHFISRALPDHGEDLNHHAQRHYGYPLIVEATLREAEGRAQDRRILDASPSGVYQVNRARQHLLVARVHLKEERKLSALTELQQARHLLKAWPGRVLNTVEHETISSVGPLMVTPSQRKVLDLLVEGWGNRRIAEHLGLSERTIAVHVGTMLKRSKATSRTELVAQEMVRRLARQ